jgi:hypothetical protein
VQDEFAKVAWTVVERLLSRDCNTVMFFHARFDGGVTAVAGQTLPFEDTVKVGADAVCKGSRQRNQNRLRNRYS